MTEFEILLEQIERYKFIKYGGCVYLTQDMLDRFTKEQKIKLFTFSMARCIMIKVALKNGKWGILKGNGEVKECT